VLDSIITSDAMKAANSIGIASVNLLCSGFCKSGRAGIYGMLGAGLHLRKGFSPLISHNLWKVYAVPKILYGLEVMPIKKKEMEQMKIMQRKLLAALPDFSFSSILIEFFLFREMPICFVYVLLLTLQSPMLTFLSLLVL
jgi:hypothetical protein